MTGAAPTHRLTLLGGAVIRSAGQPLGGPAAHRHRLALLALLAANASPVSRDKLIALLWPERDTESGRNLLKVAVHEIRKLVGEDAIRTTGDQLSIDPVALPCDLIELQAADAAGNAERVIELYAGPFLDGFHMKDASEFEQWVDGQRTRVTSLYGAALERIALAHEKKGEWREAIDQWRRLAALDPVRSDVALRLMRALDASGDRPGAIRHAQIHAELRQREFGLEPDTGVAHLARELSSRKSRLGLRESLEAAWTKMVDEEEAEAVAASEWITRRPLTERSLFWVVVALFLTVLVTTGIALVANQRFDAKAALSNDLAVVPFRVVGADSSLSAGMMEMMIARIGDDGPMRAVEARFSTQPAGSDQIPVAIQQAKVVGAGKVLVGEVVGGAGRGEVDVTATIYNTTDAAVLGRASRTIAESASIPAMIDTLAAELMARASGETTDRLPDLTRRPLPALRLYLSAQTAYRHGGYQRAESLFARALDVDSSFALAGLGLALANSWNTINDHYGLGRDVALRGMKELGARDRLFIAAFFGPDPQLGEPKPAPVYLAAWEDVVHKHPDFAEAWYHVGDRYYHFGGLSGLADPLDQARTAFRRALAIDSSLVAPLHHLIEIYASRGEADEARATAERYFTNNPGVSRDASAIGWTVATVTKDARWLSRARAGFATMPLSDLSRIAWITQANGWPTADADSALALLERRASATFERSTSASVRYAFALNAGRFAAARSAATAFEQQVQDQPIRALWNLYAVRFGGADRNGVERDEEEIRKFGMAPLSGDPDRRARQVQALFLTGLNWSGEEDLSTARRCLAMIRRAAATEPAGSVSRREAENSAIALAAAIAVSNVDLDAAALIARLDTVVLRDRVPPRMSLSAMAVLAAELHKRNGDSKKALAASRWREHYTGDPMFLATQLRMEGDLARELGDSEAAMRAYRRYLALRPSPDAGTAQAATDDVRRRLAELERK